jgi:hypothetical protein
MLVWLWYVATAMLEVPCKCYATGGLDLSCGANLPVIGIGCRRRAPGVKGSNSRSGCGLVKSSGQRVCGDWNVFDPKVAFGVQPADASADGALGGGVWACHTSCVP